MKYASIALIAGVGAVLASASANATPIEINFASPTPPKAHLNIQVFEPWTREVTAASGGTLKVNLVAGPTLATHRNVFDRVRKGVAAIGWGLQDLVPGQFPKSTVVQVPGLGEDSLNVSIALWRLFEGGIFDKEYQDVKVLAIWSFPPYSIHTKDPIKSIADIKGVKIAVNGKVGSDVLTSLGATPISLTPAEYYQSIGHGLVSGVFLSWTGIPPYRLNEVTRYTLEGPIGGNPGMIVMNRNVYEKLPEQARKAIDDHSGERLVRRFATFWDRIQSESRQKLGLAAGHTIVRLSDSDRERMLADMRVVEKQWIERVEGGAEVLEALKTELKNVTSGK